MRLTNLVDGGEYFSSLNELLDGLLAAEPARRETPRPTRAEAIERRDREQANLAEVKAAEVTRQFQADVAALSAKTAELQAEVDGELAQRAEFEELKQSLGGSDGLARFAASIKLPGSSGDGVDDFKTAAESPAGIVARLEGDVKAKQATVAALQSDLAAWEAEKPPADKPTAAELFRCRNAVGSDGLTKALSSGAFNLPAVGG